MGRVSCQVRLRSHPDGQLRATDLELVRADVDEPDAGQLLVRNRWFAIDPALRLRLGHSSPPGYLDPIPLGSVLPGFAIGEVEVARVDGFAVGDLVTHTSGWREWAVVEPDASGALPLGRVERIDADEVDPRHYLGALGVTGLTAYAGLIDIAELRPDDVVWISAAAGAVGSLAAQIATLRGHTVIGSAGSADKVRFLRENLGLAGAFNHRDGRLVEQMRALAPDGIDVYFDNVGGNHFGAALQVLRPGGRIAACGAIAGYEDSAPGPSAMELFQIVVKRLTVRGLRVGDHFARLPDLRAEVRPLLADGRMLDHSTVVNGLASAPQAFADLLSGGSRGRVLVAL